LCIVCYRRFFVVIDVSSVDVDTHTHCHTQTPTHMHTQSRTYRPHTDTHTYAHTQTTHRHPHTLSDTHTDHTQTPTDTVTHTDHTQTPTHTVTHTDTDTHAHTLSCTYRPHTDTHTHVTHTDTHTNAHTLKPQNSVGLQCSCSNFLSSSCYLCHRPRQPTRTQCHTLSQVCLFRGCFTVLCYIPFTLCNAASHSLILWTIPLLVDISRHVFISCMHFCSQ